MPPRQSFTIRAATEKDADALPGIENSAGTLFREIPELAHLVEGEDQPVELYRKRIGAGCSWVAESAGASLVGFLVAEIVGNILHIWELGVRPEAQRQGLGRALVHTAIEHAKARDSRAVTLTTFRDVPWNAPFYRSMGFVAVDPDQDARLLEIMREEDEHGLRLEWRCAMRLDLS